MSDTTDNDKVIEESLIKEACSTLRKLRINPKFTLEELLAEKALLKSKERIKLLSEGVCDSKDMNTCSSQGTATGVFSNFGFILKEKNDYTKYRTFYVCTVTRGVDVRISNPVEAVEHKILFEDVFKFEKLHADFSIDVKVFSLKYKRRPTRNLSRGIFVKFCPTPDNQESKFKLCGRFKINSKDKISNILDVVYIEHDAPLTGKSIYSVKLYDIFIDYRLSGIINVGKLYKSTLILWNVQWCVLDGTCIKLYRSPIDEDFNRPDFFIDLRMLVRLEVANEDECSKRRTLKIRVRNSEDEKASSDIYFITTVNLEEYTRWKEALNYVVTSLMYWKALVFYEESTVKQETFIF